MVKVIMGKRGSGKTKQIIEMVNTAVSVEAGSVVCVEIGQNLRMNVPFNVKLIDLTEYPVDLSYDSLFAFVCGLYSGNYDITHVFMDGLYKLTGDDDDAKAGIFLDKLEAFSLASGVKFTLTISAEIETATDEIRKYF